jgi:hypothetical protein
MPERYDPAHESHGGQNIAQLFIVQNRDTYTIRIGGVCRNYEEAIAILDQAKRQLERSLRRQPTPDFEDRISFDVAPSKSKPRP